MDIDLNYYSWECPSEGCSSVISGIGQHDSLSVIIRLHQIVHEVNKVARVAFSITTLVQQINSYAPRRSKRSDGTFGDSAHQARKSDHNPWYRDTVTAVDITHDPDNGMNCHDLATSLVASRDPRIKYVIWNKKITSKLGTSWIRYKGANPHVAHLHLSIVAAPKCDDRTPWDLPMFHVLKLGCVNERVSMLQIMLNHHGCELIVDGLFGPKTDAAVREYQRDKGIKVDGVAGPVTMGKLGM